MQNGQDLVLVPCSGERLETVPEVIRLLPLGQVSSQKGDFLVDDESFRAMCAEIADHGVDVVIDYEHQTLKDVQAPAGGWIKELVLSDGAICGRVEWTARAVEYLRNREYRYLSPVVVVRKSDRKAMQLKSVALTNVPAIDGMFPIINSTNFEEGDDFMDFTKQLAELLGLPETTETDEILATIKAKLGEIETLKAACGQTDKVVANKTVLSLLALKDDATTADVTARIAHLQNLCTEASQKLVAQQGAGMVELALKDGKITPAQKEWAQGYAQTDPTGFKDFLEKAVPVVPMQTLALSAKQTAPPLISKDIARQLGLTDAEIAKCGKDDQ